MQDTHPTDVSRSQRLALIGVMFLSTATVGFLQPFLSLYLEAVGLTRGQIGMVLGLGTVMVLAIQPLLGRLSDFLDARRPVMIAAALTSGIAYMSYGAVQGLPMFVLLSALGANGSTYIGVAGGVLVGQMTVASRGGATFTSYRVWGSVGYILVTLFAGWMANRNGGATHHLGRAELATVFLYGPMLFFAIAVLVLFVPDRRSRSKVARSLSTPKKEKTPLSPNLRWFLLAFFFYMFGLYGASAYLSLYMKSLGATPLWITEMFAAGVLCEVLVMPRMGRFSDLYGRRPALAIAFLIMPVRLLLYIPANGPLWVLMVQILHGLNYGIMGAIAIVFVNDLASNKERGTAQARLAAVASLATALSPPLCGWIAQHFGFGWMFTLMSVAGFVGTGIFLSQVQESHPTPKSLEESGPAFLRPLLRLLSQPLHAK